MRKEFALSDPAKRCLEVSRLIWQAVVPRAAAWTARDFVSLGEAVVPLRRVAAAEALRRANGSKARCLHEAFWLGALGMAKALAAHLDEAGATHALLCACAAGNVDCLRWFLEEHSGWSMASDGRALAVAVANGRYGCAALMVERMEAQWRAYPEVDMCLRVSIKLNATGFAGRAETPDDETAVAWLVGCRAMKSDCEPNWVLFARWCRARPPDECCERVSKYGLSGGESRADVLKLIRAGERFSA